jgi:hypothetical protein
MDKEELSQLSSIHGTFDRIRMKDLDLHLHFALHEAKEGCNSSIAETQGNKTETSESSMQRVI